MEKDRLIRNIADQVKEAEIKLGYSGGSMRLYYPAESLCAVLGVEQADAQTLAERLSAEFADTPLGRLGFGVSAGRVEIRVPPEGVVYVHEQMPEPAFLKALIEFFRDHHHCTLEELKRLFGGFSADYACEVLPEGADFQYLLYFPDGQVDSHYYCISDEMGHMTYHRFTKEDYLAQTAQK